MSRGTAMTKRPARQPPASRRCPPPATGTREEQPPGDGQTGPEAGAGRPHRPAGRGRAPAHQRPARSARADPAPQRGDREPSPRTGRCGSARSPPPRPRRQDLNGRSPPASCTAPACPARARSMRGPLGASAPRPQPHPSWRPWATRTAAQAACGLSGPGPGRAGPRANPQPGPGPQSGPGRAARIGLGDLAAAGGRSGARARTGPVSFTGLARCGLRVRPGSHLPGAVTGHAVALLSELTGAGQPVWLGSGRWPGT
jgi:hypothetical protein